MSPKTTRLSAMVTTADDPKCMDRRRLPVAVLVMVAALAALLIALPAPALAHGPVAPIASSYQARVSQAPPGLDAKVIDGDQRMWLKVARGRTVVVLDYRGAPYLRFSPSGVEVNHNSAIYYLNQTPVAEVPPSNLTRSTPPRWHRVSGSDAYGWHDGRLHALAAVALSPGASYVGRWTIPVIVDGRRSAIYGGLWHADDPSIAWFWPIVVILACVVAAWRLRRPELDMFVARTLSFAALAGVVVGGVARQLHGRPTVGAFALIGLVLILAFVAWAIGRLALRRPGYFFFLVVSVAALWQGAELIQTLLHGFVLAAVPAFVARAAAVICLGTGAGLLLMVFRLSLRRDEDSPHRSDDTDDERDLDDERACQLEV
jgi:hypothetical protein